ncbi:glycosyltransferase family 4 protein [Haloprofundus marisrubri]|nr:glycosyltransferase family 4 protein [Haloprofundus marisrubri]
MVLRKQYPTDVRVAKEASALLDAGHEVELLCRGQSHLPEHETIDGVEVRRLTVYGRSSTARWPETLRFLTQRVHPLWADAMREAVDDGADALHIHDLPLVRTALSVREETGVPVVADLHENYPEAIRQWRRMDEPSDVYRSPARIADYAFQPVRRWKRIEERCVREADHVLTPVEEGREHYLDNCDASPESVTVVGNTVEVEKFDPKEVETVPEADDEAFTLSYVGKFAPHRGLDTVVRALPAIADEIPNVRLLVVGAPGTPTYGKEFNGLCARLGVLDRVTYTGWVDFERVPDYMAESDVCTVTHASTPHTETTVPHKLFQYMAMERPVLVSDVKPLARIVSETESGAVSGAGDPDSVADAVLELADEETARERGQNGRAAVEGRYGWAHDADSLRTVYESL